MRPERQLELLTALTWHYREIPFGPEPYGSLRYGFENEFYGYSDGVIYYTMLREFEPKRLIEVGSGHSSALALDTSEIFLGGAMDMTFIEPFPGRLRQLIDGRPVGPTVRVIPSPVQDVPLETFDALDVDDFLFIDSSHVSKAGSDVNYLFFEVLPRLRSGVLVHIHDIFEGFEYPKEWVTEGRVWSESYLLRAFLIENRRFEILLMTTYMQHHYPEWFRENMPLCLKNPGGSIWLKVV